MYTATIILVISAYLLGSLSSSILFCRLAKLPDPRTVGSHNPGATNVLRLAGVFPAAIVLICDILKGMLPTWFAYKLGVEPVYLGVVAIAACLGHIYPIFFNFKGGKAVATAFGTMAPIGWGLAAVLAGTWFVVVLISGYSSIGAIVTALLAPLYVWYFSNEPQLTLPVALLSCLIIIRHHENIQQIWRGQGEKIYRYFKSSTKTETPRKSKPTK